jgi:uncharacterized protein YcaQ
VRITAAQARRLAVRASGLDRPRPERVDRRHFRRVLADVDVVQLDSVNVVARAHELVFHARLGPHDPADLDRWLWRSREAHECWAHVASVMPSEAWPLLAHRRADNATHPWGSVQRLVDEQPERVARVLRAVTDGGPLTVSDLDDDGRGQGFWGWGAGKKVLHWLFLSGQVAVDHRDRSFRAAYDLPHRVLGSDLADAPPPPRQVAVEELVLRAARAQGVGTSASLADHHRLPVRTTSAALDRLATRGQVVEVDVDDWGRPGWMLTDTVLPRIVRGRALVAPFDPLVWFRPRTERVFGMHYRIEIYVPEARREYGYYVLPFLLGDRLVARVDTKADRRTGRLVVRGAWAQPDVDHHHVAAELAEELRSLARHTLGVEEVVLERHGDLSPALAPHL